MVRDSSLQADILHAHMRKSYVLAGIAGSLLNKPVVATVHGMHVTAPWIVGKIRTSLFSNLTVSPFI
ncbi:glycosyltransferase [Ferruginibacter sp.]|uniref:glycosyltransferase n=1 Tax=Ferruginibacter sp. TaxID=1940288 RepID=UPI00265AD729|nr:glycosyltransferase [Ferruginibacter sp.]